MTLLDLFRELYVQADDETLRRGEAMTTNFRENFENSILNTLQIIYLEETIMIKKSIIGMLADQINFDPTQICGNSMLYDDLDLSNDELETVMALVEDEFDIIVSELDYIEFATVKRHH